MITDAATLRALERLVQSRADLERWAAAAAQQRATIARFQPRSETLRTLMSLVGVQLPWLRWAFSAFMMWRSFRQR